MNDKYIQTYLFERTPTEIKKSIPSLSVSNSEKENGDIDILYPDRDIAELHDLTFKSSILGQCINSLVNGIYGQDYVLKQRDLDFRDGDKESIKKEYNNTCERLDNLDVDGFSSFTTLIKRIGDDIERTGNAYIEILKKGKTPYGIRIIDPKTVNHSPDELVFISRPFYDRDSGDWKTERRPQYFRKYIQTVNGNTIYFKSLFDNRIVDSKTGKVYSTKEYNALEKDEKAQIKPANEVYHFTTNSLDQNGYGIPRWINSYNAIAINIEIETNNYYWFENGMKSDLVITTIGGLSKQSQTMIEEQAKDSAKNTNAGKPLIITPDMETAMMSEGKEVIDIKEVNKRSEGQFITLYEKNNDLIISSCGLHKISVGLSDGYNRATAQASNLNVENNTYEPSRQAIIEFINLLFAMWGVKYHKFMLQSSARQSILERAMIIKQLRESGLTFRELRNEVQD